MYKQIMIFAGTSEGRVLAQEAAKTGIQTHICVATEYGEMLLEPNEHLTISHQRLDSNQMVVLMKEKKPQIVVDATHPYAVEVTANIIEACKETNSEYIRLLRESAEEKFSSQTKDEIGDQNRRVITVDTMKEAWKVLNSSTGNILLTTGSKELKSFLSSKDMMSRIYARVLPMPNVVAECIEAGVEPSHLICMQGPFSVEMNCALIHSTQAKWLVTKESGVTGGFLEKCEAAKECNISLLVIRRPDQQPGISFEECSKKILGTEYKSAANEFIVHEVVRSEQSQVKTSDQTIVMVGIGIGTLQGMTMEAQLHCKEADLIIGARRMLETVCQTGTKAKMIEEYRPAQIVSYIKDHPQDKKIVIALSGDAEFYSGAKRLGEQLNADYQVCSGISSLVYLCGKADVSWEDVCCITMHGREDNLIGTVMQQEKVFALLGSSDSAAVQCQKLADAGYGDCDVYIGELLGYADEKIQKRKAKDFTAIETDALSVMLIINEKAKDYVVTSGISDTEFLRDKVPMTKEEVRSIVLAKLRLTKSAVCYDIGAGSGSVSIEMARVAVNGKVYAIERKETAVDLIRKNQHKFGVGNMKVIAGLAPKACVDLEPPTHVFIGGSAGNLKEILQLVLEKNPSARIVVTAISMETTVEMMECLKSLPLIETDIVTVSVGRAEVVANYHLMKGQNPITIFSFRGNAEGK